MVDLLSLVERQWINALCVSYIKRHKWNMFVQEVPTVHTPIPPIIKKGAISPTMIKWTRRT
jgi:hypothetical protein